VVTVHNFDERPVEVKFKVGVDGDDRLVDLREETESRADERGVHHVALDAYGYRWFRVGGLNYALHRRRE
jgi:maltose alpha-D-glucosyltransferase/alpha-amylase